MKNAQSLSLYFVKIIDFTFIFSEFVKYGCFFGICYVIIKGRKRENADFRVGLTFGEKRCRVVKANTKFRNYRDKEDKMLDKTMTFSVHDDRENEMKENLMTIYNALKEKGYNPINQLVGYILSEDPTYITTYNNARALIRHIDRDELLQVLVKSYLSN